MYIGTRSPSKPAHIGTYGWVTVESCRRPDCVSILRSRGVAVVSLPRLVDAGMTRNQQDLARVGQGTGANGRDF